MCVELLLLWQLIRMPAFEIHLSQFSKEGVSLHFVCCSPLAFTMLILPVLIVTDAPNRRFAGDPLGRLCVSEAGVMERDRLVWAAAAQHRVPILMLLSGGYTRASTPVIAHSIQAVFEHFGLGDESISLDERS